MTVKYLSELLSTLDQSAIITVSSDEEGNNTADIDSQVDEREANGRKIYTLFPIAPDDQFQA